ncbi:receptor homology region, transmembrane domain- and RING domain-containing protein 1 isoform X2 [Elaeis guineensis]|uniref:Receptor homology region, transmembrane domain- and RING domain-containing protein 1 n=2 Tax=Elaeis guineensis var. tenera TaxID=51953 RepID=A0A6I9QS95_ELAGV|nr:receptor homology region, transmembrane domain- and RING domain-containing protein 1 [Elaeis guineensis]XP_010912507.1 receptor homology region, transmembrane domain- and RING domain-containing protein 1 [Elaeis guineensis]
MASMTRIDGVRSAAFICAFLFLLVELAYGSLVLFGRNMSKSFDDIEADFAPVVRGSGESGGIYLAEPLDACTQLNNKVINDSSSSFALIIRGGCHFDEKVRNAQNAGFKAAVIYNNEDYGPVSAIRGIPDGITIPAVFISKASGEALREYAGDTDMELWILPRIKISEWSILAFCCISFLVMSAGVLAPCFFVRRQYGGHEGPRASQIYGMSSRLVEAIPSLIFTSASEDNCTSQTCAICLEDYKVGEKLRVLPCHHKFHAVCVDSWLTTWRTFCPVCKQDVNSSTIYIPASESTPLLSSLSSFASSSAGSLAAFPPNCAI